MQFYTKLRSYIYYIGDQTSRRDVGHSRTAIDDRYGLLSKEILQSRGKRVISSLYVSMIVCIRLLIFKFTFIVCHRGQHDFNKCTINNHSFNDCCSIAAQHHTHSNNGTYNYRDRFDFPFSLFQSKFSRFILLVYEPISILPFPSPFCISTRARIDK